MLSDAGNAYARQFDIVFTLPADLRRLYEKFGVDLAAYNGDPSWSLPMPTRVIADRQGIIRDLRAEADYTKRPEPANAVAALRELTPGA